MYKVKSVRDGRTFATRSVTATQNGRDVFVCSVSFVKQEKGVTLDHQVSIYDLHEFLHYWNKNIPTYN